MPNLGGLTLSSFTPILAKMMYWMGIGLVSLLMIGVIVAFYFYLMYNIKVDVFPLYGSGRDGVFSIARRRGNRCAWNKARTAWKPLFPLFNRKEIEPFDQEYIYPGNRVYAFDLNGVWVPGRCNVSVNAEDLSAEKREKIEKDLKSYIDSKYPDRKWCVGQVTIPQSENQLRAEISPVPYYVRNWQSLQHKKNAVEYAEHNWWTDNKTLFIALMTGVACLVAVCVTVYFTYKFAGLGRSDVQALTAALKGFGSASGSPI